MRAALALVVVLAACSGGDKMTSAKCRTIMNRAAQCMDPSVKTFDDRAGLDDEMTTELCADPDTMQRELTPQLSCLDATTCADFNACFRATGPIDSLKQLLPSR